MLDTMKYCYCYGRRDFPKVNGREGRRRASGERHKKKATAQYSGCIE